MFTLFSCPRSFEGDAKAVQRNAVQSWTLLNPKPEIILLGNDPGIKETCLEFGLVHTPSIQLSQYGPPFVESVFSQGQRKATNRVVCYVNADIILLNDFIETIKKVVALFKNKPFLIIGGRWNVKEPRPDFSRSSWSEELKRYAHEKGWLDQKVAMDYFVFPKEIDWQIPPFALGRGSWDSWFAYKARSLRIPIIDISKSATVIHPDHPYPHLEGKGGATFRNPALRYNLRLLGFGRRYLITDSTYRLENDGLVKQSTPWKFFVERVKEIDVWIAYYLDAVPYPYAHPLYKIYRMLRKILKPLKKMLA